MNRVSPHRRKTRRALSCAAALCGFVAVPQVGAVQAAPVDQVAAPATTSATTLASVPLPAASLDTRRGFTQCDFIHPKIDVDAQVALFEHMKKGDQEASEALVLLGAVQQGVIAGILQADRKIPALMARAHGDSWWTMVPDRFPLDDGTKPKAIVYPTAPGLEKKPVLAYKKAYAGQHGAIARAVVDAWTHSIHEFTVVLPEPSGKACGNKPVVIPEITVEGRVHAKCDMGWPSFFEGAHRRCYNDVNLTRTACAAALALDLGPSAVAPSVIKELFSRIKPNPALEHCKAVLASSFEDQVEHCVSVAGLPHYRKRQAKCSEQGKSFPLALDHKSYVRREYERWLDSTGRRKDLK